MRGFDFSGGVSAFLPKGFDGARAARLGAALAVSMGAAALLAPTDASAQGYQQRGPELHYQGGGYRDAVRGGIQACQPGYAAVSCYGQAQDGSMVRFDHRGRAAEVRHPNGVQVFIAPDGARTVVVPQPQDHGGYRGEQRSRGQDRYAPDARGYAPEQQHRGYGQQQMPQKGGYHGQPGGFSLQNLFGGGNRVTNIPSNPGGPAGIVGDRMGPVTFR